MALTSNVGNIDKVIRIVIGVALAAVAFFVDMDILLKALAGGVAAIALLTAVVGVCPLYSLLGINSCKRKI